MFNFDNKTGFLIKSSQGPSLMATGRGSQMAKKNPSNIIAAKTIKVQNVLLMLCRFVCLQNGFKVHYAADLCFAFLSALMRAFELRSTAFPIFGYLKLSLDSGEQRWMKAPELGVY